MLIGAIPHHHFPRQLRACFALPPCSVHCPQTPKGALVAAWKSLSWGEPHCLQEGSGVPSSLVPKELEVWDRDSP